MLRHDAARCTGCGTCVHVCAPGAIVLTPRDGSAVWEFAPGRCTFCGRCADYCPTAALGLDGAPAHPASDLPAQRVAHEVFSRPCERCGAPMSPLPPPALVALYGVEPPETILAQHRLCDRCRRKNAAAGLKGG
jgi:ferredoxin